MAIKRIFIVSALIFPMFASVNAQASEQPNKLAEFAYENFENKKDSTQTERLEEKLDEVIEQKENKLASLKRQQKTKLKQKKSLYRAKESQAQYTLKRELKKIEHNQELSGKEKVKLKRKAEQKYKQVKDSIEKAKLAEFFAINESFEHRIKATKERFVRRIQSIEYALN